MPARWAGHPTSVPTLRIDPVLLPGIVRGVPSRIGQAPGPCQDCLAWGVRREHNWRCWSCRGWRSRHPVAQCPYCARQMPLGTDGACRLCWQQAAHARVPGEPLDLAQANRVGQQLFLANMHYSSRRAADGSPAPRRVRATAAPSARPVGFRPAGARQLTLFQLRPNLITLRSLPRPPHPGMAEHCELILREHATAHGWSKRLINLVAASLRAVQAWQATPGDKVMASEVSLMLSQRGLTTVESTLEVLSDAGLLDDDRVPAVRTYFRTQTADLPAIMTAQLGRGSPSCSTAPAAHPTPTPPPPDHPPADSGDKPLLADLGRAGMRVPRRDHPRSGDGRASRRADRPAGGRRRAALPVQRPQGPQSGLQQPHRRHRDRRETVQHPDARGHRSHPGGTQLARARAGHSPLPWSRSTD